jgi:hypothetical protein
MLRPGDGRLQATDVDGVSGMPQAMHVWMNALPVSLPHLPQVR